MRKINYITSFAMMMLVLVLGVVIPTQPDLDDDDDNVGCAAVMPCAERKSVRSSATVQVKNHTVTFGATTQVSAATRVGRDSQLLVLAVCALQVSPPLRA